MSEEPERVDLETPDLAAEKRAAFEDLFPGVLADGVLDATRLGELLDTEVTAPANGRERFGLMWAGKQDAVRSLLTPGRGTLVPEFDKSIHFDDAHHVFIEGDNLEVLKLLQKAYNDRVKLIYIDPPYNTGTNDFIYPDDFSDTLRAYLEFTGQVDTEGRRTSAGADVLGRRHSRWLSMMYPRLVLARNLLTQDGVIFVSIDDNEVANLRELMDEVFGSENFVASVIWHKVHTLKNTARQFSEDHDYLLCYARNADLWIPNPLPRTQEQDARFTNPDDDPRGPWISSPVQARNYYSRGLYPITTPGGRVIDGPPPGRYWSISEERFRELDADGRVYWGPERNNVPRIKRFLSEMDGGRVPQTIWGHSEVGHNQTAKQELINRVKFASAESTFDTPKPTALVRQMLRLATSPASSDIVLDFFAGSGATADAVLQQNADDEGDRRLIAVQLPEPTGFDDYAFVSGITRARIVAAMEEAGSSGLRCFRLEASSFRSDTSAGQEELFELHDTTLTGGEPGNETIAAEVLLKEGVSLDTAWNRSDAGGAAVISAGGVAVVLSLDITDEIVEAALALGARVVVFLEDGFAGADAVKANAVTNARNREITLKTV
jgi:adenine-specific DNA-methyltransferase